jgi:predicted RNase H-like HicB family nuclease
MSDHAYRVVVTRDDSHWLADVPELQGAHTYARSLPTLDQAVREVIVLAADLPDEAMPELVLDYDYHTGDPELDTTALEVRRVWRLTVHLGRVGSSSLACRRGR